MHLGWVEYWLWPFLLTLRESFITIFAGGFWMSFHRHAQCWVGQRLNRSGGQSAGRNSLPRSEDCQTESASRLVSRRHRNWRSRSYAMTGTSLGGWQIKMAVILIPVVIYGLMFLGQKFPATERVQRGISTAGMYKEALRPLFLSSCSA